MNLTRDRLSCALSLDLTASATDSGSYTLGLATDRIEVRDNWQGSTRFVPYRWKPMQAGIG